MSLPQTHITLLLFSVKSNPLLSSPLPHRRFRHHGRHMEFPTAAEEDHEYGDPTRRPTRRELLVAGALLELHHHCQDPPSCALNWRWAAKRKRSSLRSGDPIVPAAAAPAATDGPCPSKPWPDASSPDTPLIVSYSGGSPEPKSAAAAAAKIKSVEKRREELRLAESAAQEEKECLRRKIEMERRNIEWQKSLNLEWKRMLKLVVQSQVKEKGQSEKVNTSLTLGLHSSAVLRPHSGVLEAQEPSMIPDRTAPGADNKIGSSGPVARPLPSLRPGVTVLNLSLGPPAVPDLNLPVEESGGGGLRLPDHVIVDSRYLSRAAAATARQRRYRINKAKLRR